MQSCCSVLRIRIFEISSFCCFWWGEINRETCEKTGLRRKEAGRSATSFGWGTAGCIAFDWWNLTPRQKVHWPWNCSAFWTMCAIKKCEDMRGGLRHCRRELRCSGSTQLPGPELARNRSTGPPASFFTPVHSHVKVHGFLTFTLNKSLKSTWIHGEQWKSQARISSESLVRVDVWKLRWHVQVAWGR